MVAPAGCVSRFFQLLMRKKCLIQGVFCASRVIRTMSVKILDGGLGTELERTSRVSIVSKKEKLFKKKQQLHCIVSRHTAA